MMYGYLYLELDILSFNIIAGMLCLRTKAMVGWWWLGDASALVCQGFTVARILLLLDWSLIKLIAWKIELFYSSEAFEWIKHHLFLFIKFAKLWGKVLTLVEALAKALETDEELEGLWKISTLSWFLYSVAFTYFNYRHLMCRNA